MPKTLLVALTFVLLIGLSPISNHMTMQMDTMAMSQHDVMNGGKGAGDNSFAMPCCDAMAQTITGCAFLVHQYSCVRLSGGSERIGYSTPLIQSIYLEILAPPPKS